MKSVEEIVSSMTGSHDPLADAFEFIVKFGEANTYLPHYDEIAQAVTLLQGKERTSRSLIAYYMNKLEQIGDLTIWRNANGRMIPGRYIIHGAKWKYEDTPRVRDR